MNQHIPDPSSKASLNSAGKAQPLVFPVEGMSCASCVKRVEVGAAKVAGVTSSAVNFATKKLTVETEEDFDPRALEEKIRKLGYEIPAGAMDYALREAGMTAQRDDTAAPDAASSTVPGAASSAHSASAFRHGLSNGEENTSSALPGSSDNDAAAGGRSTAANGAAGPFSPLERKEGGGSRMRGGAGDQAAHHPAHDHSHMHASEEQSLQRDLALAVILTLPLFLLEMTGHLYPPFHHWLMGLVEPQRLHVVYFVLATAVIFGPGLRFLRRGLPALGRAAPDMNSLVAIGVLAAYGYSAITTWAPQLLPQAARLVYYEAATVIVTLILFGRLLEARATGRAGAAIETLVSLRPQTARVERNGTAVDIPTAEVLPGDVVVIRPGERLPVDGTVIDGRSHVDEAMITGEPVPVAKQAGASVTGGTINTSGSFRFRAEKVGRDTVLAHIIRMVEQAQGAKLPIQNLVDRVTAWFVPAVMAIAIVTFAGWYLFGPEPALTHGLISAVAVLIIACPCAMGLAVPVSIVVGGGRAAELGVLFRRGDALQALQEVKTVVLDKTGTLTVGRPELTDLVVAEGFGEQQVLALVAAAEARSEHPVAQAIVKAAEARGLAVSEAQNFSSVTGYGITARVTGHEVAIGADRFMEKQGLSVELFAGAAARLADEGKSPLYAAVDGRLAAMLAVADPLKPGSADAVRILRAMGFEVVMVTGDNRRTAQAVAHQAGIEKIVAEVLPEGKVQAIDRLRGLNPDGEGGDTLRLISPLVGEMSTKSTEGGSAASNPNHRNLPSTASPTTRTEPAERLLAGPVSRQRSRKVAFVGDGINDAPALAAADVGIAIGTGTDVAIETADVVLVGGELSGVVSALAVSRATMRNIKQNLLWAFGYNVALIPLAAGLFYPFTGLTLSPMLGAAAMALSSVFVLFNALRLRSVTAQGLAS